MSDRSSWRDGKKRSAAPSQSVREQKREQFSAGRSKSMRHAVAALSILVVVAAIATYAVYASSAKDTAVEAPAAVAASPAPQGDVRLPLAEVSDGTARFYSFNADGTEVKYFVLKSSDGVVRAAFDACDVCYAQKKGYAQEGDEMVCLNCGRRFPSTEINVVEGGCNPSPLDRKEEGKDLVIAADDIRAGARYFR